MLEVMCMYHDKIALTMQSILEKEFKVDARGYRMQEVDQFLDIIIRDYNEYNNIINNLINEKKALSLENSELKQIVYKLKANRKGWQFCYPFRKIIYKANKSYR